MAKAKARQSKDGFKFSKSLGQNFLQDQGIIDEIVDAAQIGQEDLVIEIGPGGGALTKELIKEAGKLIAVELDDRLIPELNARFMPYGNFQLIHEDILKVDLQEIIHRELESGQLKKVKVIGNLPYYITTPIIMGLLEKGIPADSITIMMQKEVGDRILAKPNTKAYGALSIAVQYYSEVEKVLDVPRHCFYPQPNVDSIVLKLNIKKQKDIEVVDEGLFFETVKAGFGMRRKTLLNSLTLIQGIDKGQIGKALDLAGIDPARRAETLTIEEFATLAKAIGEFK
ncbi:MAG: 16S rRNA (adenine(1518)-N(6)/adenine(1519)-N(6))-dimethyltransferase RsmA [Clostridia bacterium]|nr:16S rRNA (adenine(1518)-N(6)/adenine(1519)-N(6))-dimethyltransferase RsmA [Clostridia bacterium]